MRMLCKRHARKGKKWIVDHYFTTQSGRKWRFYCKTKDKKVNQKFLYLKKAMDTKIRRHIKIKSEATPFNPLYKDYRSEEHTSEIQSLMRTSYAVFCLKK